MGTVVTIMNMKGGVGKTTVTINLSGILSQYAIGGKSPLKILIIDYDPQFNLSQAYLSAANYFSIEENKKTTLSVLVDSATKLNPYTIQVPGNHVPPAVSSLVTSIYPRPKAKGCLDILPSTLDLMYVALGQATTKTDPIEERFRKFIEEAKSQYDLVLIDCHPAGSLFTKTSLMNSDHVLIPVMPQKYAIRGIGLMMQFMNAKKIGSSGPKPIILFNSTSRIGVSSEETAIRSNPRFGKYCLATTLKKYKAFSEPEEGKHFVWQSKKPYSSNAFENLMNVGRDFRERIGV